MSKPGSFSQTTPKIAPKPGKSPLVIKRDRSITIRGKDTVKLMEKYKFSPQTLKSVLFKEDIIYESRPDDFLKGNPLEKVIIVNMLDKLANASRTVARFYSTSTNEILRELTSDNLVKLIGQTNYDTLFSALCSVINLESKVRGILSLLTAQEDSKETSCKQEIVEPLKSFEEKCCQTEEDCMDLLFKYKEGKKKRIRKLTPYVVTDNPVKPQKRVVIHPNKEMPKIMKKSDEITSTETQSTSNATLVSTNDESVEQKSQINALPDIKVYLNEDSNCSNLSGLSNFSADNLLKNPNELLKNVDRHTNTDSDIKTTPMQSEANASQGSVDRENWPKITLLDGTEMKIPVKPEDDFHIATPEILKCISDKERVKLLWYQAYIDWKYCLEKDADGYLPIHVAVATDDVDMLRRQCLVLRSRHHTLDVFASDDLTPLQMALLQDTPHCGALVGTLLRHGADPLLMDSEQRSPLHMAAEAPFEALQAIIAHCQKEARSILEDHEELWKSEYATKSDEELTRILLDHVCNAFDGQGYTPLMIASRRGFHRSVELLLEASPTSVNTQTPNAGDTALFVAVGAACMNADDRGNRSSIADHFKKTINALLDGGADAFLENLAGFNVNDLLSEKNISELSLLINNKITSMNFFDGKMLRDAKSCGDYILEDNAGEVSIRDVGDERKGKRVSYRGGLKSGVKKSKAEVNKKEISTKNANDEDVDSKSASDKIKTKEKPIILENIELPKRDAAIHTNTVFINNSNVKFLKPQDKLEKITSNAIAGGDTNVKSISSNVAIQNISNSNVTSNTIANKNTISSAVKKIVVLNFSHNSVVGNTPVNPNVKVVSAPNTVIKRKITQTGPSIKKQKVILNSTVDKKT